MQKILVLVRVFLDYFKRPKSTSEYTDIAHDLCGLNMRTDEK